MCKLYMAVSADKYELPIFVTPYAIEMAERFGLTVNYVEQETHSKSKQERSCKRRGYRLLKVNVEDDYEN